MRTFFGVLIILFFAFVVAPWVLMVALGILGVSLSFFETVAVSWLLSVWIGLVVGSVRSSS